MSKLVLHLFNDNIAALSTVPALAERIHQSPAGQTQSLEVYIFGPAEGALVKPEFTEFNTQVDSLVKLGVRVTTCIGLAQKYGAESAFKSRGIALESAAVAFPRFADEGATVMGF
jgi:hypothetical protein